MYIAGSYYCAWDEYPKKGENWSKVYGTTFNLFE